MDEPHSLTPDDIDRQLAAALRVDPSAEFRARIRERLTAEEIATGWRLYRPAAACAALGIVLVTGTMWFMSPGAGPVRQASVGPAPSGTHVAPAPTAADAAAPQPARLNPARTAASRPLPRPAVASEVNEPIARPVGQPAVLLSESEQAGVRLLFESLAAGRLELPEEMLRDSVLPIIEARTDAPASHSPWDDNDEGDRQ
jgi:hypothetical protein